MIWAGHVVHIQQKIRAYRVFVEMPPGKGSLGKHKLD
jgi:hypothetical protein